MSHMQNMARAFIAAASLNAAAQQPPAPPAVDVMQCETSGRWHSLPVEDFSTLGQQGASVCTDLPFAEALPGAATRSKYLEQLRLGYKFLDEKARLGQAVQSGDLDEKNLPNLYVVQQPYASDRGGIVYSFELRVRRPASEATLPLPDETSEGASKRGTLKGLMEVAIPSLPAASYSRITILRPAS